MRNIWNIAKREFLATVATRAFIIGLLIVPVMGALLVLVLPRLVNIRNIQVQVKYGNRSDRKDYAGTV